MIHSGMLSDDTAYINNLRGSLFKIDNEESQFFTHTIQPETIALTYTDCFTILII